MANQEFYSRIIHKHDTEANWKTAAKKSNFTPKQGEIIVYDIDNNHEYERMKIGDGIKNVDVLPFIDKTLSDLIGTKSDAVTVDTAFGRIAKAQATAEVAAGAAENAAGAAENAAGAAENAANNSYVNASISGKTITLTKGDGSTKTLTTQDTNTTYTFATGDSNGQIKVTPSGGTAQNVSIKGLGSAAYTASTAYATAAQGTKADNAVPTSRTINNKALTSNITLSASDVGAVPKTGGTINGNIQLNPGGTTAEGGQIDLYAAGQAYAGTVIDNYDSCLRIFGIASADGTSKTGVGTPLVINPYSKTIAGGYIITGTLNGNATSATKATQDGNGKVIANTYIPLTGSENITGGLFQKVNGNPYYGLNDGATDWYLQALKSEGKVGLGPSWVNATKWDASGNMEVAGSMTVNSNFATTGTINCGGGFQVNRKPDGTIGGSSLEIYHTSTPYIDFHYGGTTTDYTSRIIENASGTLSINGVKCTTGGNITTSGTINSGEISATRDVDGVKYRVEVFPYKANIGGQEIGGSLQLWTGDGEGECDSILTFNKNGLALRDSVANKAYYYLRSNDDTHTNTYYARTNNRAIKYATGELVNIGVRTSAGSAATTNMIIMQRK